MLKKNIPNNKINMRTEPVSDFIRDVEVRRTEPSLPTGANLDCQ